MAVAARLGGQEPDDTLIGKELQCVNENVHKVAVILAPPQKNHVDYIVVLKVNQL
jgi:hypothetical protein